MTSGGWGGISWLGTAVGTVVSRLRFAIGCARSTTTFQDAASLRLDASRSRTYLNEPSFSGGILLAGPPLPGGGHAAERKARAHHGRRHQGLRRARLPHRHRGGDRARRRRGRWDDLPVFQEQGRSAAAALRREDDRAARGGALGDRPRNNSARPAAPLPPAPTHAHVATPPPHITPTPRPPP